MKQDQNVERLLQTLKELTPAEPSSFRYARIKHKIAEKKIENEGLSGKVVWEIAAAFMLLITLNISVIYTYSSEVKEETTSSSATDVLGLDTDNYYENNY